MNTHTCEHTREHNIVLGDEGCLDSSVCTHKALVAFAFRPALVVLCNHISSGICTHIRRRPETLNVGVEHSRRTPGTLRSALVVLCNHISSAIWTHIRRRLETLNVGVAYSRRTPGTCTRTLKGTQTDTHIHVDVCVCMCVCMCVCVYVCMCVCMCVRVYVYDVIMRSYAHQHRCSVT